MNPFSEFGIQTDADEQARRAVRAGFARAGLAPQQFNQAMTWHRDHGRQIKDPAKIAESFSEFAAAKHWSHEHIAAAMAVRDQITEVGAEVFLGSAPTAEEDAATIAKATELLRSDAATYWSPTNAEMREAWTEALERDAARAEQTAATPPTVDPAVADRQAGRVDVDKFAAILRDPQRSREYWSSPELQEQHRVAIARSIAEPPVAAPIAVEPVTTEPTSTAQGN
jgi:hypothetical protein